MSDSLLMVFQGPPYVEGNGMSSLYKLQVKIFQSLVIQAGFQSSTKNSMLVD